MHEERLKLCHLQLLPIMSGVQRSMLEFLKRLDQRTYDLSVVCKEEGDLTKELTQLDIPFHLIPSLQREINLWKDSQALWQLYTLFKTEKFDLIHTHSSKTGLLGRVAGRMADVTYIFHTVHGLPFHEFSGPVRTKIYTFFERLAGKLTDQVIFVNNEERTYAVKNHILQAGQVRTIYNGVDLKRADLFNNPKQHQKIRNQWDIPLNAFVVAFVGRLWEQKDPQTLSKVIAACTDLPIYFLIVGDGPYFNHFKTTFSGQSRVKLVGWMDDCFPMYPAIDVLLLPSLWEGLSVTLIEAMAFGKPLIASNIKGNRECVFHGHNGLLCTPQQPEEFKKAIQNLYSETSLYQTMSMHCIEMAHRHFDIEQNAQKLSALYEERFGHGC